MSHIQNLLTHMYVYCVLASTGIIQNLYWSSFCLSLCHVSHHNNSIYRFIKMLYGSHIVTWSVVRLFKQWLFIRWIYSIYYISLNASRTFIIYYTLYLRMRAMWATSVVFLDYGLVVPSSVCLKSLNCSLISLCWPSTNAAIRKQFKDASQD